MRIIVSISVLVMLFFKFSLAINPPSAIGTGNNIILWLSPDSGIFNSGGTEAIIGQDVAEWRDISGNGFNFTNVYPTRRPVLTTYSSKRYLDFTPGDFFENTAIKDSINGLDEFSIFITIKSDVTNTDNGFMDSENPNNTDDKICLRYDASGANTGRANCLKTGMNGNTAANQVETQANTQTTNVQVLTLVWKDGEKLKVFIDGVLNDSSSTNVAGPLASVQKIILGKGPKNTAGGLGGGSGWDGLIGDVIFYNKKFSADTIQKVAAEVSSVKTVSSGNWNDTLVWDCNCIPPYQVDVTISAGHTVVLDSSVHLGSLNINSGGSLDLTANNYQLDLLKHLNVQGSLLTNQGKVSFSGTEPSLITGSFTVYDLEVNKSSSTVKAQSGLVSVSHLIEVPSGTLDGNNRIVLLSNSSQTAYLGQVGGTVVGNFRIQRYIDGMGAHIGYRHFSLPIENGTISDLQYSSSSHPGGLYTFGFSGSNAPSAGGYISVYNFDESVAVSNSNFDMGWIVPTSTTDELSYKKALTFYSGGPNYPTYNIEVSGIPNQGPADIINLSYSSSNSSIGGGWHLIGNPFACSVNWGTVTKSGIDGVGYIFSETGGGYIPTNLLTNQDLIAPFQGLLIHVNNATNAITFNESDKSTTQTSFLRSTQNRNRLRLSLTNKSNGISVPIALDINENATASFDREYDAFRLNGSYESPSCFFAVDTFKLQVNTLSNKDLLNPIDIGVTSNLSDSMVLKIEELPDFEGCFRLYDNEEQKFLDLIIGNTYTFWVDHNDPNYERFTLITEDHLIDAETKDLSCFESEDGEIQVEFNQVQNNWVVTKNLNDTIIVSSKNKLAIKSLESGFYQLKWGSNVAGCGIQTTSFSINEPKEIMSDFSSKTEVEINEDLALTNYSSNAKNYYWLFNKDTFSVQESPNYSISQVGTHNIGLVAVNGLCKDSVSTVVKVKTDALPNSVEEFNESGVEVIISNNEILIGNKSKNRLTIKVFSLNGIATGIEGNVETNSELLLNVGSLSRGVYLVQYFSMDGKVNGSKKVVLN